MCSFISELSFFPSSFIADVLVCFLEDGLGFCFDSAFPEREGTAPETLEESFFDSSDSSLETVGTVVALLSQSGIFS